MKILATSITLIALGATGCASLQPAPAASEETHRVKIKDSAEDIDLAQVQNQLSKFVEIVELLNQTKQPAGEGHTKVDPSVKQSGQSANPAAPNLEDLISAINDNLEQLDNAEDEAQTARQMLSIADQFSGNKNIFSGIFDIILKGAAPTK